MIYLFYFVITIVSNYWIFFISPHYRQIKRIKWQNILVVEFFSRIIFIQGLGQNLSSFSITLVMESPTSPIKSSHLCLDTAGDPVCKLGHYG